ncbi:MAG TPA: glycosyltransferase family 4 protein [Gammaproteobacteria bacterium]|nr:glycosyltransferase family 4 protein [Gammaproteobacteria bacterium]
MRIAQVAPLVESVPPAGYGGTERVVHYLTEELVRLGHDVTLFASGDSCTSARLESGAPQALRRAGITDYVPHHLALLERLFQRIDDFDIVHFHLDYLHYPWSRRYDEPHVTTLHGRLDLPELVPLYREYPEMPVVSISDAQRAPLPWLNWQTTVLHGMPVELYQASETHDGYLAFLGRVSPEKGLDQAIAIAEAAGLELRIAAKVDTQDRAYYEEVIVPLLRKPGITFLGEVGDDMKNEFLGRALALLFPIGWDEPFGMVMMEAMACGTPVIAYPRGSVPEVLEHGVTGFLVPNAAGAVQALSAVESFDRRRCRQVFEERFSASRMTQEYLACYDDILERRQAVGYEAGVGKVL